MQGIISTTKRLLSAVLLLGIIFSGNISTAIAKDQYTSDLATDPTKASSSTSTQGRVASRAFDNSVTNYQLDAWEASKPTGWLMYDFGTGNEKQIEQYTITKASGNEPRDWSFEGSNGGSTWDVLHTVIDAPKWTGGYAEKRTFQLTNSNKYRFYRINVTRIHLGTPYLIIGEMEMMEKISSLPVETIQLSGISGDAKIVLSWQTISNATSYNVKRSLNPGGPYETIVAQLNDIIFEDSKVDNGTTYYYVVTANTDNGESQNSNEVALTPNGETNTPNPAPNGDRGLLVINFVSGAQKEFDLSSNEIEDFLDWYEDRANGKGNESFMFDKQYNKGPFTSRHDYVTFRLIESFEVKEYNN